MDSRSAGDLPSESPPPDAMDALLGETPQWPRTVGTISIVWAGLGLTCTGCGVASLVASPQLMKMGEAQMGPMPDVFKPGLDQWVMTGLGLIPTLLLLWAGIATVMRSTAGRALHLAYAATGLVIGCVGIGVAVLHQLRLMAWATQNPDSPYAAQANSPIAWVVIAVIAVLSLVWPVFCLVWFGAVKRRAEEIAAG